MEKGVAVANTAWRPIPINMTKQFWVAVFMAPLASFAQDFAAAEKLMKPYDAATRTYLYERLANDDQSADDKRVCTEMPGGGVTQILRINQDGVVDLVVSNVQTPQSECFEKFYMGRSFKAPPTAPIYTKHKIGYNK